MIVEDDESIRYYVRVILELELGVKTITAEDGDQALALLSEPLPAFILTDVRMPRLDGTELIRKLRAWPATCRIPITVMADPFPPAMPRWRKGPATISTNHSTLSAFFK